MPRDLTPEEIAAQYGNAYVADAPRAGDLTRLGTAWGDRVPAGLLGIGEAMGLPLQDRRLENQFENQETMRRFYQTNPNEPQSFRDINSVGDLGRYAKGLLIDSSPELVTGLVTGGVAGGVYGLGGLGRTVAGAAANAPSALGDILQNQREAGGRTDLASAALLTVPYAAADMVGLEGAVARGSMMRTGLKRLDDMQGLRGAGARLGANVAINAPIEGASETFQEMINQAARVGVNPQERMFGPDALERYQESFVGGAVLGGGVSGALGGWRRSQGYQAPEAPQQETNLLTPEQPMAPEPRQYGLVTQPAPLQQRINEQLGIGAKRVAGKKYAAQFEAAFNEPTGQYVQDPATGIERQLTVGEMLQRDAAPMDLTVANPAETAAAANVVSTVAKSRDPQDIMLRDTLNVIPNQHSRALLTAMVESGIDPQSKLAEPVWNFAGQKYMTPARLTKALTILDESIIEARKGPTNVSPAPAPIPTAPTGLAAGSPLVQGGMGATGPSNVGNVQPNTSPTITGTPAGQTAPAPATSGQPTTVVKTQRQLPTTRGAAGTTPLVDTSDDALEIARATGNAAEIEAMREDEAGLRADRTSLTDEDTTKIVATRFAKSKNAKRDGEILNAYLTALRTNAGTDKAAIQNAIGDRYGITAVAVRKIGNPSKLVEAGAELGFSAEQVLDLFQVDDNTKAQYTEIGKLEAEIKDLRKAYDKATDADKRAEVADRMAALSERITKIKEKAADEKAAAFSAGLQEAGVSAAEGESAGFGFDTEREWSRVEGESKLASQVLELSNQIDSLRESAEQLAAQGQTEAAQAARDAIAARQAKIDAVLAEVQGETKPVSKAAPDVAEARKRWNDAGRDLTKLSVEDLQVLKGYTASIKNKALSDKIAAEISSRGATQEAPNAVQVQSPAGVSVQPKTEAGQGVGQEVRRAEKPASKGEVAILTPQEQYEKVTAGFPVPAWADLTAAQQGSLTDLARRDQLNLAAVNRFVTAEETSAPAATTTPEQRKTAESHAKSTGGNVVWQEGDHALVRGFSRLTGAALYSGTKGDIRTTMDIRSAKPKFITPEMQAKMVAEVERLEAADAEKHATDPFIKFDANGLAVSANVDSRLAGVVAGWKNLLNLKTNIYVTTIEDARADQAKFTGVHRSVGSAGLDPNEAGSMRKMGDGYYITFTKGTSYLKMLETIAHEMGHVHEREAFENAPAELKQAIRAEHDKFIKANADKTGREFVQALRARTTGRTTRGVDNMQAAELTAYWKSFSEWYADQVSKWATTSEKPVGVVEQFFAKLGAALKKFYYALKGEKYLPNETMKQFLDDVANRTIVIDSKSASKQDFTSQAILAGTRSWVAKSRDATATDRAQLAIAKLMDANNESADDIWAETGWYKNPADDKWRFEIPDESAKFKEKQIAKNTEYALGDVLSHPALYDVYPQLPEYVVEFDGDLEPGQGSFDAAKQKITLSWNDAFNMQVLLHEIQHAVQNIEGFGRGGNPNMTLPYEPSSLVKLRDAIGERGRTIFDVRPATIDRLIEITSNYRKEAEKLGDKYEARVETIVAEDEKSGVERDFTKDPQVLELRKQIDTAFEAMKSDYAAVLKRDGGSLGSIQVQLYQLISGEQEAEIVAERSKPGGTGFGGRRSLPAGKVSAKNQLLNVNNVVAWSAGKPTQGMIAKNVAKLPKAAQQPVRNMLGAIGDVTGKGLDYLVFTSDLVNRAVAAGIPSAKKFVDLIGKSKAEARENEIAVEKIADLYALVPEKDRGTGENSVNRFLFDSTRESKWGYGQYRDQVMGDRFDALSKESQDFVKAVFEHGSNVLAQKKKVVLDSTNSEYDAMIAVARANGDKAAESKLINEKKATIKRFQTLFKIRDGMPYAPIKRNGSHVVIAKSKEYLDAEAAGDAKKITELESNSDHYHVTFTDGKWEGRTLQQQLVDQGAFADVQLAERDTVVDEMFSGHSALRELTKMRSRVDEQARDGDKSAAKMLSLISQMYLEALAEGSARKSEMRRRGVEGEVDMIRSFAQQGRADANFMASVKYNPQVQDALQEMRTQSKTGDRARKSELFNELAKRYVQSMEYSPRPWLNKLTRMSSIYYLATSPAYYLQNLTQPWMMSVPAMAGQHDYTAASGALFKAYTELGDVMKSAKLLKQQFDFDKVPADVRDAIKELVNRGKIDIGLDTEIGEFKVEGDGYFAGKISAADKALRLAVQKVESINRLSTAMAAYRLELARTNGNTQAATDYADRILTETHGDYTSFNAPRAFNTSVGKVALQFRKFQLIQIAFYAKLIKDALQGNDRKAALKTLAFSLAHTGTLAGLMGMPGYAAISWAIGALLGDDDEPFDVTAEIRKAIGDEAVANLVLKGTPTLLGADISGKVGAGNMLSIMPFSQADLSTTAGRAEALGTLIGGASLGMASRMVDGLGLMLGGDWYRGIEQTMPKGVSDAMKAWRTANEGMTRRNGDIVVPANEISTMEAIMMGLGVTPVQMSTTYERQNVVKELTTNFQERTTAIKNQYTKADRKGDAEAKAEAREAWKKLQDARVRNGLARQPLSNLLKAPAEQRKREKETVGGVQYTKATKKLAQQYAEE